MTELEPVRDESGRFLPKTNEERIAEWSAKIAELEPRIKAARKEEMPELLRTVNKLIRDYGITRSMLKFEKKV